MKNNRKKFQAELAKGQVWKTRDAYLQIMDRGKRLISYKMMKEMGRRAVPMQMSAIAAVETYLKENEAELVEDTA
jgi:hypothetical protein